ncbi:hypothetical protein KSP35_13955 [Aquihabitans sp. G128]|uniref:hypothetical protein n=1 Tax=Aquihabitans sp. G128 TaxID=2849779 RepID=UPI001C22536B|nr:hypothetical protein [Aquihabitans sp. G128]QXC59496.1 hypothetical protein KSP35_13955 [Aquihabitans sp. G128]
MRTRRAAGVLVAGVAALALAACNPPASNDTAWKSGGVATTAAPAAPQKAEALAVAPGPDGSTYVAVATSTYPTPTTERRELTLRKLGASGWDLAFEAAGPLPGSLGTDEAITILPAPDGTIYVKQHSTSINWFPQLRVWHVQADGHLATGFGDGGRIQNTGIDVNTTWPATVDASSRLLVAIPNGSVVRYLPDGSPDPAFANPGGTDVLASTPSTLVRATNDVLATVSDGGVVGPSFSVPGSGPVVAMAPTPAGQVIVQRGATLTRLTAAGAIDTGWGTGGSVTPTAAFPAGSPQGAAPGTRVQADGATVLTWAATDGTGALVANLTRLTPAGAPDAAFGTAGVVRLDRTANATPAGFGLQATGSLGRSGTGLVAGTTAPDGTGRITRFDATGQVITSFGTSGSLALDAPTVGAIAPSSAITLADGHAVVAMLVTGPKLVLAKFAPNGNRATSFGVQGVTAPVAVDPQTPPPVLRALPDGRLLVATGTYSIALTRFLANGQLDTSWGTGGTKTVDAGGGPVFGVQRFAVAPDGSVVVAGQVASGGPTLLRISAGGVVGEPSLVPSGTPRANRLEALALDSKGRPVVVTTSGSYGDADLVMRISRLTTALAPDPTFNGGTPRQIATGPVSITDLDIAPGDRPVVLVRPFGNPATSRAVRLTAAGAPDATFGSGGTASLAASPTAAAGTTFSAVALAVDAQGARRGRRVPTPQRRRRRRGPAARGRRQARQGLRRRGLPRLARLGRHQVDRGRHRPRRQDHPLRPGRSPRRRHHPPRRRLTGRTPPRRGQIWRMGLP